MLLSKSILQNLIRKVIKLVERSSESFSVEQNEFELRDFERVRSLNHENIIKFYEKFDASISGSNFMCLIIELCEVRVFLHLYNRNFLYNN